MVETIVFRVDTGSRVGSASVPAHCFHSARVIGDTVSCVDAASGSNPLRHQIGHIGNFVLQGASFSTDRPNVSRSQNSRITWTICQVLCRPTVRQQPPHEFRVSDAKCSSLHGMQRQPVGFGKFQHLFIVRGKMLPQ